MKGFESWVIGYLVNSLWMVPLVFTAAWIAARAVRRVGAAAEHRVWVAALLLEARLPGLQVRLTEVWHGLGALKFWRWGLKTGGGETRITVVSEAVRVHGGLQLPEWIATGVAVAYACSVVYFAARLGWGLRKTRAIGREAEPVAGTGAITDRWARHLRGAGVADAALAVSTTTQGPATMGVLRGVLVVPPGFFDGMAESELDAVMAHECAHMRRHDFAKNVLYGVAALPVGYHPLLWMTFSRLKESREMVCDAMAADVVAGRERYARSLLRLASLMIDNEPARTIHAIGIFDANSLERRVMNLTKRSERTGWAVRTAILAVCVTIGVATCASAMALRMEVGAAEKNEAPKPVKVRSEVLAGLAISQKLPVYPAEAKANHVEGAVVLKAIISKEGDVQNLQVASGPEELRAASIEAVKDWKYKPYVLNGDPTEVETTITVNYSLAK